MKKRFLTGAAVFFTMCALTLVFFTACPDDTEGGTGIEVQFISATPDILTTTRTINLEFNGEIPGLAISHIVITPNNTGAVRRTLTHTGGGSYVLEIFGVTGEGNISIAVNMPGYRFTPASHTAAILYDPLTADVQADFTKLEADGLDGVRSTTRLTLTFNQDIFPLLAAADVSFEAGTTGAVRGPVQRTGSGVYDVYLMDLTESGTITVKLEKPGYTFSPSERTVDVVFHVGQATAELYGLPNVGQELTVIDGFGTTDQTFRWYADDVLITGATARRYRIVSADLGKTIKAVVSRAGDEAESGGVVVKGPVTVQETVYNQFTTGEMNGQAIAVQGSYHTWGIVTDSNGDVFFVRGDAGAGNARGLVGKIDAATGAVSVFSDTTDESGNYSWLRGLAIDEDDNLYVANNGRRVITKVTPDGNAVTYAGIPGQAAVLDGPFGTGTFGAPFGVAVDNETGNVYVGEDTGQRRIRRINPDGSMVTVAGDGGAAITDAEIRQAVQSGSPGRVFGPGLSVGFTDSGGARWLAIQGDFLYVSDDFGRIIRKIDIRSGDYDVSLFAFTGAAANADGNINDGTATSNRNMTIAFDPDGNLWMRGDGQIPRVIQSNGDTYTIETRTDPANNNTSALWETNYLTFDKDGNFWTAGNYGVKRITITIP